MPFLFCIFGFFAPNAEEKPIAINTGAVTRIRLYITIPTTEPDEENRAII